MNPNEIREMTPQDHIRKAQDLLQEDSDPKTASISAEWIMARANLALVHIGLANWKADRR